MDKFIKWDAWIYSRIDAFIELIDSVVPFSLKMFGRILCALYVITQVTYYDRGAIPTSLLVFPVIVFVVMLVCTENPKANRMDEYSIIHRLIMTVVIFSFEVPELLSKGDRLLSLAVTLIFWLWLYTTFTDSTGGRRKRVPLKERLTSWFRPATGSFSPVAV